MDGKTLALLVKAMRDAQKRDLAYPTMATSYLRSENEYEVDTAVAKMLAEPSCDELRLADDGCPHHPEMSVADLDQFYRAIGGEG